MRVTCVMPFLIVYLSRFSYMPMTMHQQQGRIGLLMCFVLIFLSNSASSIIIRNPSFKLPWKKILHQTDLGSPQLSPVILLPGDGGSQLEAKLNKTNVVHYFCAQKTADWFDLWLNIELLLPYVLDCWVDNMKLVYNNVTKRTENSPGVDVRVSGFGNATSVEYLDASRVSISKYFIDIVDMLVARGYKRDVSIRGAPYDFRRAPDELGDYFVDLKKLIEETYETNNQTAVTFVAHSMGNLMGLHLLHQQTPEWKDKYIKGFVSLAAPWGGAIKALKAMASGDNLNVALISAFRVRAETRTNPSLTFIFPNQRVWDPKETLIFTPERNYSLSNMEDFFLDMEFPEGWEMYKRTENILTLKPPGVPMYCLYGVGVDTPTSLVYPKGKFPDSTPTQIMGDGDGTVNLRSFEVCADWQSAQPDRIQLHPFKGVNHMTVLSDKQVLGEIEKIMLGLVT